MPNLVDVEEGQNWTVGQTVQRKFWKNPKFVGGVGLLALVVFLVGDGSTGKLFTGALPAHGKEPLPSSGPNAIVPQSNPVPNPFQPEDPFSSNFKPELPMTESLTTRQFEGQEPPSPSRGGQVNMQFEGRPGGAPTIESPGFRGIENLPLPRAHPADIGSPRGRPEGSPGPILVQGGSLRTWSYHSPKVEQVQVVLTTEGRPMDADMELWHGPDNTPFKLRIYSENGETYPFTTVIETPRAPNTVAMRNIGQIEFPFAADLVAFNDGLKPSPETVGSSTTIQGGALRTFPFDPSVKSVEVLITTQGNPLNARVELLQGPNNNKQVVEVYTEDGIDRPFFCIIETPGSGNVVRVVNTGPVEFPIFASTTPHSVREYSHDEVVLGGDISW